MPSTTSTSTSAPTPQPLKYAPVTGYFSYYSQTGVEHSPRTTCCPATTRCCSSPSSSTCSATTSAKGGSVAADPRPGRADRGVRRPQGAARRRRGRPWSPSSRRTGKILAMASLPTLRPQPAGQPRLRRRSARPTTGCNADPSAAAAQPGDPDRRCPPGSTFKLVTAAAAIESGNYTADSQVPGGATLPAAADHRHDRPDRQRGPQLRHRPDPVRPGDGELLQHHLRRARPSSVGADALREQAETFGFNSTYLDDLGAAGRVVVPRRDATTAADRRSPASASSTCRPRRCRWRWSRPAIANGGTVMKPYLVDEVQSPDLDVLDKTEPAGARPARSRPQTADELTKMMVGDRQQRHRHPAADPRRRGGRQDRHRAERHRPTRRRTPGSSRSRRPTTPRSRSR